MSSAELSMASTRRKGKSAVFVAVTHGSANGPSGMSAGSFLEEPELSINRDRQWRHLFYHTSTASDVDADHCCTFRVFCSKSSSLSEL